MTAMTTPKARRCDLDARARMLASVAATCLAATLMVGQPAVAQDKAPDANTVIAKVNGAEIKQSDLAVAEEELGPSLAQMAYPTMQPNPT